MSIKGFSELKHINRGSWVVSVDSAALRKQLGWEYLPVLRRFPNDPQWNWPNLQSDSLMRPDLWWMQSRHSDWRELLKEGAPAFVRHATPESEANPTGSVGNPIGVFETSDITISKDRLFVRLIGRLL